MANDTPLADILRVHGMRMTAFRKRLVALLGAHKKPVTAADILSSLPVSGKVNKTTVYRELEALERAGIIKAVSVRRGAISYERADREHHHHVICNSCGSLRDTDDQALERALDAVSQLMERRTGFRSITHALEFFGTCPKCK